MISSKKWHFEIFGTSQASRASGPWLSMAQLGLPKSRLGLITNIYSGTDFVAWTIVGVLKLIIHSLTLSCSVAVLTSSSEAYKVMKDWRVRTHGRTNTRTNKHEGWISDLDFALAPRMQVITTLSIHYCNFSLRVISFQI